MSNPSISGPDRGFGAQMNWDEAMVNNTGSAFAAGDVVEVEMLAAEAGISANDLALMNVTDVTAAGAELGILGVCLEDIAAAGTGQVRFRGRVAAATTGDPQSENRLAADKTPGNVLKATSANSKVIALPLEEVASASGLTVVLFDGVSGFGNDNA